MVTQTFAHISDLHIGAGAGAEQVAARLARTLFHSGEVDHVILTGDVTHTGRREELARFREIFRPLLASGRLLVVPGNHDRLNDDVAGDLMPGARVQAVCRGGLYFVQINSTGEHNRRWLDGHGELTEGDLEAVERALDHAPEGSFVVLMLHHHVSPLPEEDVVEWFSNRMRWPCARELPLGGELLRRVLGRCDLVLHGHRHVPGEWVRFADHARPVRVCNAGSSTRLQRVRTFSVQGGVLLGEPRWVSAGEFEGSSGLEGPPPLPPRIPGRLGARLFGRGARPALPA
jgi:Icc protein